MPKAVRSNPGETPKAVTTEPKGTDLGNGITRIDN